MIANGDYILDGITIRAKNGYLCDLLDEEGHLLPAVETHDGNHMEHWKDGELHCQNAPAVIDILDGYEEWWSNGRQVLPQKS